jgi:hypothetical protein
MFSCFRSLSPTVNTIRTRKRCKYHKHKNRYYLPQHICEGFCYDAYYGAYPYFLALLYNSISDIFEISCPNLSGIKMRIERRPCSWFRLRRGLKWILGKVLFPIDWPDWHISILVVQEGQCPYLKASQIFHFKINDPRYLCPASFHTIFPTMKGKIYCPDHKGQIYDVR